MKTTHIPEPLFDNLNYWESNLRTPPAHIENSQQEYQWARDFLYSYRGSEATFNAYRRDIERLYQWSWWIQKKSLTALTDRDIETFIQFCQSPPKSWINTKKIERFITTATDGRHVNSDWRPFTASLSKIEFQQGKKPSVDHYRLSTKALQATFAILSSFYTYLLQKNYVAANPVAQVRQKSKFITKQQTTRVIRRLSELQWGYVIETARKMAEDNPAQHERTLFIMSALYGMYLRISELVASARWTPQMGDFQIDPYGNWWFVTVGKGNKQRQITVSNAMLDVLKRYRTYLGLPALPSLGETRPLIQSLRGTGPVTSTRQIRTVVQTCFDHAIARLRQDGFQDDADQLQAATVHWLRHTGISDDVKHRPREHVRDDAGHSSSAITDKYIDIELNARHASGKHKHILPDDVAS